MEYLITSFFQCGVLKNYKLQMSEYIRVYRVYRWDMKIDTTSNSLTTAEQVSGEFL